MLLFLLACTSNPCPDGSTVRGKAYSGPVTAPSDAMAHYTHELECIREDGKRHGPAKGWFENGQLGMDVEYRDGEPHKGAFYDAWGHVSFTFDGPDITRTFWTEKGDKVLEGRWKRSGGPVGTWQGWGRWKGTATYDDAHRFTGGDAPWGPYIKDGLEVGWAVRKGLPTTRGTPASMTLAVQVFLTDRELLIDGERVATLDQDGWLVEDLRGQLIAPLYDRMREKAAAIRELSEKSERFDFTGEWNLSAQASTPIERLEPLLFTAQQAGFDHPRAVVETGIVFPPQYGPPLLRGGPAYGTIPLSSEPTGATLQAWIDTLEPKP